MYKKSRKHYIVFPYSEESPLWTDFHQILHIGRYAERNYLCKFRCGKIKGFGIYGRGDQILGSPIEMAGHLYNSVALPHSLWSNRCELALLTHTNNAVII